MSITTIKNMLNLVGRKLFRQCSKSPGPYAGNRGGEINGDVPSVQEKSGECPKRPAHRLRGMRALVVCMAFNEVCDIRTGKLAKSRTSRGTVFAKKLPQRWQMSNNRDLRKASLFQQVTLEVVLNLLEWSLGDRSRWRVNVSLAKYRKKTIKCRGVTAKQ